jgi:acyl carrier protein
MEENKKTIVRNLIKEKLGKDEIDETATLATYGLDSLDVMEFLMDLENKFDVRFEGEDLAKVKTVGELLKIIDETIK